MPNPNYAALLAQIAAETDPVLKQALIDQAYVFTEGDGLSDNEIQLFEFVDFKDALKLVKGMFAIVLFDLTNNRIYFIGCIMRSL